MTKMVTLYGIDDGALLYKDYKGLKVVSVQARECKSTYVVDHHDTMHFLNYKVMIGKRSHLVSLSPREALLKYIDRKSRVVQTGQRAAKRKAEAEELLNDYS